MTDKDKTLMLNIFEDATVYPASGETGITLREHFSLSIMCALIATGTSGVGDPVENKLRDEQIVSRSIELANKLALGLSSE